MSAHSGKKKRLGSRRHGGKTSETSEPEEVHVKDNASVAQPNIAEDDNESLNVSSNPECSRLETKPSSPELRGNRRKLGSSRKSKGRQHVKESNTEPCDRPREEIEVNTNNETFETMSLAAQPEKPKELSQGNDHDVLYGTNDSSLHSVMEVDVESLIPKNETLQAEDDQKETVCNLVSDSCKLVEDVLEGMDKLDNAEVCHQVEEHAHVDTSEFNNSSPALDQRIDQPQLTELSREEFTSVDSVIDAENKKSADDKDMLWQEGNLESNYLVRESHFKSEEMTFATTSVLTTDKSSLREVEFSVEQAALPTAVLFRNEEENDHFNSSEVRNEQEVKHPVMQETREIDYSFLTQQNEIRDTHQSELRVESFDVFAATQDISNPDEKQDEHPIKESNIESLDKRNEEDHKEPWISKKAPYQVYEGEVAEYTVSNEETVHHKREEVEDREYVLQQTPLDSQPLDDSVSGKEQNEMQQTEGVIHGSTEKFDICSENLMDQTELSVKGANDSATMQEIANPDDKQDEYPIMESNMESLDKRNKEDYAPDSDRAPCLLYEGEGQVEDDTKPNDEGAVQQVKEGIPSEDEEGKSSLQILQSEIKAPLDSQPQDDSVSGEEPTNTSFNPIRNRRKMGSSRKNKGRQHIKDPVTDFQTSKMPLDTEPTWQEEFSKETEPDMTDEDSLSAATTPGYSSEVQNLTTTNHPETALNDLTPKDENLQIDIDERETDSTLVSEVCESVETMLIERDTSNSSQIEDISDQVQETPHLVDVSALTSISEHSSSTVEQQLDDQYSSTEMSNEFPSVHFVADTEKAGRDYETNLFWQDGNESHEKPEDIKFPTTPEIASDKSSFGENTEIEFSVEQAAYSLPTEELSTNEEQNENFIVSEVKQAQYSEDAVNEEHKQEVKETQMEEIQQTDHSSESVIQDATEHLDIFSENLIDQSEIRDTYQPELTVEGANDSANVQEIANPNDKQDEHPVTESNIESLDQRNEDDHESNINEPWISNIAPCQVEDDTKPSDEETFQQDEEGNSLQILQSVIKDPLDSKPQDDSVSGEEPTNTSFNPIRNRRKMGSSRKNKGRQHIKDPVTESYHTPTEEVVDNMRGSEAFQTSKMPLTTEPIWQEELSKETEPNVTDEDSLSAATTPGYSSEVQNLTTTNNPETALKDLTPKDENLQADIDERETDSTLVSEVCESVETMLMEGDMSNSSQIEDISDQVQETPHLVDISALTSISEHSSSTVDQQLGDQYSSTEMSNEFPSVHFVANTEKAGRDYETNLFWQDGNESHEKPEDIKFPTTPEIASDKSSFGENTEIEFSVEQAAYSLPTEELSTNEEQNENFIVSEDKQAQYSEDVVNEEHKQEVKETQMEKIQQTDHSSESVIHDATEHLDIFSENLIDQSEIRDTYQPELTVEGANDSANVQEIANPDDKQDEHPVIESNIESLDQRNEEDHLSNINEPWISNMAPGQVEDDTKPNDEETVQQVKQGIPSEDEEGKSSLQILQSVIKTPLDSQPQDDSVSGEEPTNTSFNPIRNRRKMGSSRKNKGRQHIKDPVTESYHTPTEEVADNMRGSEAFQTSKMPLTTEPTWQEELSKETEPNMTDGDSLSAATTPGYSSEVQNLTTTNQETQMEEIQQTDHSSESVIHDATDNLDTSSENLTDQTEIRDTYQPELTVEGANDSAMTQEIANPDDKPDEHHVTESNIESLDQRNEDDHESNINEPWISNIAPCQVEDDTKPNDEETVQQVEEGNSLQILQSEIKTPLDSQPQDDSVSGEEPTNTSFNPIRNRRKMGSSRKNKGRQHIKEPVTESYHTPTEEVVEKSRDNEDLEITKSSIIIAADITAEENSVETMPEEMDKIETSQTHEVSDQMQENAEDIPNKEVPNFLNYTEKKEIDEDSEMTGQHGYLKSDYLVSKSHVLSEDVEFSTSPEITTEINSLKKKNEIIHRIEKEAFSSPNRKLEEEQTEHFDKAEVRSVQHSVDTEIEMDEQDKMDQIDYSSVKDGKSSRDQQSAIGDSQHQDDSVSMKAPTHRGLAPTVNRRKLGSSRKHKGRQPVKDSKYEDLDKNQGSEVFETMKMSSATETTRLGEFKEPNDAGLKPAEEIEEILNCSTVNKEDNTENMQEEDTILSENAVDNNASVTVDVTSSSDKDDSVKSKKEVNDKETKLLEVLSTIEVEESAISNADDASTNQQDTQENSDDRVNLQIKSNQKRRKLASTRRTLHKNQDGGMDNTDKTDVSHINLKLSPSMVHEKQEMNDVQVQETNISDIDDLMFPPEQSASFSEEVVNAIRCFQASDTGKTEKKVVFSVETSPENTQSDKKEPKDIQGQDTSEPQSKDMNEGAHDANFEKKNASSHLNLRTGRRKMGSTRRNLGAIYEGEDLYQKQEVDNEATETNVGNEMTGCASGIKENELRLQKEPRSDESEPGKEKVFERVQYCDTFTKPPGHQAFEENPDSDHLFPSDISVTPSSSPKHDAMSKRKRKFGSNRRSLAQQTQREGGRRDTETGRDETIMEESGIKTSGEHREESSNLDKTSEVVESDKKPSSVSVSKTGEHSRPGSEETPVQHHHLVRESQTRLSLESSKATKSFNVVMVGNSNVGKTSFMKRARSGKFSFDLPSSIGLDSCLWTVLVDGKPVVLKLWDTAGQERFHSITKQIFHKAQAFLLMYDITSAHSFSAVRYWASCIQEGAMEDTSILLVGNKSDHAERQVTTQEGETLAKEYNLDFIECSAATGENVVQSLEVVARLLSQKFATVREEAGVVLHKEPEHKKTSGCC